jgi:hypothetical protein
MIPDTTIEKLEEAMTSFDHKLRNTNEWEDWEKKGNYKYAIKYDGKLYPPKHIIYLATDAPTHTFSGGNEANDFLRKKGLTIVPLNSIQETQTLTINPIQTTTQEILSCYKKYRPGDPIGKDHEIWGLFEQFVQYFSETKLLDKYPNIKLEWSAGIGRLTALPWISFLDTRETNSTQEGVYCVFLFCEDMTGVYWTLNQGVTKPKQLYGDQEGRQYLKATALKIRAQANLLETANFATDDGIDLHTKAVRGIDYELSTIAYKLYESNSIPADQQLIEDVDTLLDFYTKFIDSQENIETEAKPTWIFQANPKYFDLTGALKELKGISWLVQQYKKEIKAGDKVYLWEAGKDAGIVALAQVLTDPEETYETEIEKKFNRVEDKFDGERLRVVLNILETFETRIKREELLSHPILEKLAIITFPNATNFALTPEQAQALWNFIKHRQTPQQIKTIITQTLNPSYPLNQLADDLLIEETIIGSWIKGIERKGQVILYGPPGTGKTFTAEKVAKHLVAEGDGFTEIVQFHPAYAYEDFIQGLRPKPRKDGGLDYAVIPGRFLDFCNEATKRNDRCVLIIDEINRANLARVFGELMYLLEYRDREIPLSNGGSLKVPLNVRIIGTMNTADRSIALVDHALRRRFAFIPLYPFYEVLLRFHKQGEFPTEKFIDFLKKLNKEIGDRHYEIGISFFLKHDLADQIEAIWKMEIEPYLEEYFFDQPDKVELFRWDKLREKIANESNESSNN